MANGTIPFVRMLSLRLFNLFRREPLDHKLISRTQERFFVEVSSTLHGAAGEQASCGDYFPDPGQTSRFPGHLRMMRGNIPVWEAPRRSTRSLVVIDGSTLPSA